MLDVIDVSRWQGTIDWKKVKGAILVAGDEIVGAGLLPRQFKADFVIRSDFLNQFRLKYL